jgi:hypothetical protein
LWLGWKVDLPAGKPSMLAEGAYPDVVEIKMDKSVKIEVFKPVLDTQCLSSYIRPTKAVHA